MLLPDHIDLPLTEDDSVVIRLVRIPAGKFLMGARVHGNQGDTDEEPVHEVSIPFDFFLAQTPVTQQQFAVWTKLSGLSHDNGFPGNDLHPAERMDWQESAQFCQWATGRYNHCQSAHADWPADYRCALPSEAQWEYACSAWQEVVDNEGGVRRVYSEYHTGDGESALQQAGWFVRNNDGQTHAVGQKQANRHGLFDMHGNVWEWCADGWAKDAYRNRPSLVEDPLVSPTGNADRVVRGGSWGGLASGCRAAYRAGGPPDGRGGLRGFRVGLFSGPFVPARTNSKPAGRVAAANTGGERGGTTERASLCFAAAMVHGHRYLTHDI